MQEVDRLGWAVTVPLRAGNYVLGVRVPSEDAAALVRELFADRHVPDAAPPGNLSLWLAPPSTDGAQDLHRLYETYARSLRTRSVSRAFAALWHELDAWDDRHSGDELLAAVVTLIDQRGWAHLLNSRWRRAIVDDERRWQRAGLGMVERRWVRIDPEAGCVTVPKVPERLSEDALVGRIDEIGVDHRPTEAPQAGSWPIASWTMEARPLSRAKHVALSAGTMLDLHGPGGAEVVRSIAAHSAGLAELEQPLATFDELRNRLAQLSSVTAI